MFPVHTAETAPAASRQPLKDLAAAVGFVPNLAAAMSNAPGLLKGFLAVRSLYEAGSLSPAEIQVLSLTAAVENEIPWCVAFHSLMAEKSGVSKASLDALRAGHAPLEPRLGALSTFARTMIRSRGAVNEADLARFTAAGYSKEQALEVVLGMAFSLMANYAGHLADVPLDPPFVPHAWKKG